MDRRVTPPKRVTSPNWGPHLHAKRPEAGIFFRPKGTVQTVWGLLPAETLCRT